MRSMLSVFILFISFSTFASSILDQPIGLNARDCSTSDLLKQISKQTKLKFVVDPNIQFKKKLSIDVKSVGLKRVLDILAREEAVSWRMADNVIRITAQERE